MLVFIDESGDPGIKSHLQYFIIALLIFDQPGQAIDMQNAIRALRLSLGKQEFKFSSCKPTDRDAFFRTMAAYQFRVEAIIVDKHQIRSNALRGDPRKFYNFFLKKVLISSGVNAARVQLDGKAGRSLKAAIHRYLNARNAGMVRNFQMKDSKSDELIQAADMIAGAISRSCYQNKRHHDRWHLQLKHQGKIHNLWRFK